MIRRWETPTRYYIADLHKDLLGDFVVLTINGGRFNRLGHVSTVVVDSWSAGVERLNEIGERRRKRHYVEVTRND